MRRLRSTPPVHHVVAALVLALAGSIGCGSTTSSTPIVLPGSITSSTTSTPVKPHGPRPTPGNETFCNDYYHDLEVLTDELGGLQQKDPKATVDPAPFMKHVKDIYRQVAASAPSGTQGDFRIVSDYIQTVTSMDAMADLTTHPEVKAANDRHVEWVRTNCGFDPNNLAGN